MTCFNLALFALLSTSVVACVLPETDVIDHTGDGVTGGGGGEGGEIPQEDSGTPLGGTGQLTSTSATTADDGDVVNSETGSGDGTGDLPTGSSDGTSGSTVDSTEGGGSTTFTEGLDSTSGGLDTGGTS